MKLDELMYRVDKRWYWLQWAFLVVLNTVFVLSYIALSVIPDQVTFMADYGFTESLAILSGVILFYLLIIYWIVAKYSMAFATFLGSIVNALPVLYLMNATAGSSKSIVFFAIWIFLSFLIGSFGPMILIGTSFVSLLFVLLQVDFVFANIDSWMILLLVSSLLNVVIGYLFWRNKYINQSSEKVNQLSGQLLGKEQQASILIQSISDGIIVVDTEFKIALINSAAATMTQWPEKEVLNFDARSVLRLVKDSKTNEVIPDNEHPFSQVLIGKKRFSKTLELFNRRNEKVFISLVVSPVIIPKENKVIGAIAVFRDVSAERSEEQRRAEFISTASHEMRTPVAAIEGYLALAMNEKVSKIDPKAREFLDKAHKSTQHLGKLFQDLLTSAKAEDGRLTSHPVVVEMGEFVKQLAEDLKFSAEKKKLEVEFLINSNVKNHGVIDASGSQRTINPLYYAHVDPDRLREVVTNVFDNAVKYTPEGSVKLSLTGNENIIQISVADTGPGISQEDLPHLFQKFYRVDNSATRSVGGTGLGLFICKKIIELYKGTIWAESELNKGTKFYINLPRLTSNRAQDLQNKEPKA